MVTSAFHMSPTLHPIGRVLKGNGRPKVSEQIEQALESFRPSDCLSRLDSVFSREVPDFTMLGLDGGYIYRVEPRGVSRRHDARWIGLLQQAELKTKYASAYPNSIAKSWPDWTDDFVARACSGYWSGAASEQPLWEILSPEAEVAAQLSDVPMSADSTRDGWSGLACA